MSTNEVDAPARPAPSPIRGGIRGFADRWPFRRKLNALVGVPLAVVAVLLAYLIADQVEQSRDADSAAQLVRDSVQVAQLVDLVESEHQQAILLSVRQEAATGGRPPLTAYRKAQSAVDSQVEKVRRTFGDRLPDSEAQALREINGLGSLRETIEQSYLPADNIDPAYTNASKGLIDGLGLDRNSALAATFTGNLLDSLLRADAAHSSFETSVFSATTGDTNALIEYNNAVGSYEVYAYQADRFARFASESQTERLGGIEHSTPQSTIGEQFAELQVDPSALQAKSPEQIRRALNQALGSYPEYRAQAESRLKITTSLIGRIADRADAASSDATWRAVWLLSLTLFGFAVWIAFSVLVRRSVVRPVQALTGAAQQTAEVAGRELARVADDDAEDDSPPQLREVPVAARDEIGDLAEAFNHVQATAAALLERQVLSRRNVAEMFGNVGRRVSNLTTRQLALIDAVERGETDPALLERLYSIDHIAVRLRRNADSLMLLAGIRETVLESGPTALTNVVRASLGQIEGYQRVQLYAESEVMVEPDIIGDLTLMIAELMENAVAFSPAGSPVEVSVRTGGEGALIQIADHGLGMSAERLEEENSRLIRRERLDLVPTKVLGLFVVGTLARRWGIEVTLSRTPGGGVTAQVGIPTSLLLTMSPVGAPAAVEAGPAPAAVEPGPARTAVEAAPGPAALDAAPAAPAGTGTSAPATSASPSAASGPLTSSAAATDDASPALPRRGEAESRPGALPRRVPQREKASGGQAEPTAHERSEDKPLIPRARTGEPTPAPAAPTGGSTPVPQPRDGEATPARVDQASSARTEDVPLARRGDIPPARAAAEPAHASPATPDDAAGGPRPLRRRVRGATLRTTLGDAAQRAAAPARPADADEVRSSLEEFEAAVERAHRDSDTGSHPAPRPTPTDDQNHQNHLPEGAEQ